MKGRAITKDITYPHITLIEHFVKKNIYLSASGCKKSNVKEVFEVYLKNVDPFHKIAKIKKQFLHFSNIFSMLTIEFICDTSDSIQVILAL